VRNIAPWPVLSYAARPGTARYRYDWITPLAVSRRPPHAVYLGAQVLFRSRDGGQTWSAISPDLTGADPRASGCERDVPVERATACGFGTIFAIAPSPAADGVVWVGTTNGRVQLTRDEGASWADVTPQDLGDWTKVNLIDASSADAATAYVAADRHRRDDFRPLAWRTHDFGATWTEIGHGLPAGAWVGVVRQDPRQPGLLYAGTSRGVHVSFDDGDSWHSLQLDLPVSGINDLLVHDDDVIVATQGRAIWVLDEVAPLRAIVREAPPGESVLVPPGRAYRLRLNQNRDTPLPPEEPRGENPPVGAVLDYVLPDGFEGPVAIEIRDAEGALVRTFRSDQPIETRRGRIYFAPTWRGREPGPATGAGHHRFVWDLRLPPPPTLEPEYSIAAIPGRPTPLLPQGAFVLPGRYEVRLSAGSRQVSRPLEVAPDPRVATPLDELAALADFQRVVAATLSRGVPLALGARRVSDGLEALLADPAARSLRDRLRKAEEGLTAARGTGSDGIETWTEALGTLFIDLESADAAPTGPQRQLLDAAVEGLARGETRWKAYEREILAPLRKQLSSKRLALEREPPPTSED
jgi:hypothetical protein